MKPVGASSTCTSRPTKYCGLQAQSFSSRRVLAQASEACAIRSRHPITHPRIVVVKATSAVEEAVVDSAAAKEEAPTPTARKQFSAGPTIHRDDTVMLQGFGWDSCEKGNWYDIVQSKIPDIQAAGVNTIWLPPPSQSVAPQGYLPGQLYNLSSSYGNKEQLISLNKALREAGIVTVADIVINHRCADGQDENGVWNKFSDDIDHNGKPIDWGKWAITSTDPDFNGEGNEDSGEDYAPAPDLDHHNPELRASLKDWLRFLRDDIGFQAWRFDFVKGYAGQYVGEYVGDTVGGEAMNVVEYWSDVNWEGEYLALNQDANRQVLCDYINSTGKQATAFDFTTKAILQEAMNNCELHRLRDAAGKAPGLIGWWPEMAVTFLDNHDTGSTQQHWPFPGDHLAAGYAYILTHPGIPCIFWDHLLQNEGLAGCIRELVDLRKRNNIKANSQLEILAADDDFYCARIADSVVLKLGSRCEMGDLLPREEDGWKISAFGDNFATWERSS